MTLSRGWLIVVEGCDRSGKSTQCQLLCDALNGIQKFGGSINAELRKYPERSSATGQIIDQYLKSQNELDDHAIHLLFSANRWESMNALEKTIDAGTTVIIDRYAYSGVAFSASKGLDFEWCKHCDVGLLKPDLVLFLDLDPQVAQQRGDYGQERYENLAFQTKARDNFLKLKEDSWKVIDANKSIQDLANEIINVVTSEMRTRCKLEPLSMDLWKKSKQ